MTSDPHWLVCNYCRARFPHEGKPPRTTHIYCSSYCRQRDMGRSPADTAWVDS